MLYNEHVFRHLNNECVVFGGGHLVPPGQPSQMLRKIGLICKSTLAKVVVGKTCFGQLNYSHIECSL